MGVRCFWLERTDRVRRWLRRYSSSHMGGWTCAEGWHEAMRPFDDAPAIFEDRLYGTHVHRVLTHREGDRPPDDDPRWPAACATCGTPFPPDEVRQFFYDLLYRRTDTGTILTLKEAPPGAMWDAWWLHGLKGGPLTMPTADGRNIMVKCPNGREWHIDGRASNCTLPNDNAHHCWIRHGEPPNLIVDKNGRTCSAGAGSIQAGDYHGFLGTNGAPPGCFT